MSDAEKVLPPTKTAPPPTTTTTTTPWWSWLPAEALPRLQSSNAGLSAQDASERARRRRPAPADRPPGRLATLARQLKSPLIWLLVAAAVLSLATGQLLDAAIVLTIVGVSVGLGASREYSAESAAAALRARIHTRASVWRDGAVVKLPIADIVIGDVVELAPGSVVPADALLIETSELQVSEAMLTGESFPVEKHVGPVDATAALGARSGAVFSGTNVTSGSGRAVVTATGADSVVGVLAGRLKKPRPDTEFERGVRRFGYLLTIFMLVVVIVVFAAHVIRGRAPVETLLFAVALAVGLSPELLPVILSINLSRGAAMMAKSGVLVRHLDAIENLGSMDVLCTDKTGTITVGVVELEGAFDVDGVASDDVLALAAEAAAFETGVDSPLDAAILRAHPHALDVAAKVAEIPFDAVRKRMSVVVRDGPRATLICKGAFQAVCAVANLDEAVRAKADALFLSCGERGVRLVAVATRDIEVRAHYGRGDEAGLTLRGFLAFADQPKPGVQQALAELAHLGVHVKVITGDNHLVARHVAAAVGIGAGRVMTGADVDALHGPALWHAIDTTDVFAEVDPSQKEQIILALKKLGHVVGFLGDGVNDAPAMHAADTSLSVDSAVDVAREAADFVLLERDLDVIRAGIIEGRRTFANTLKYICMAASANFGNMASMAVASLFLPFLPMLAGQILMNNLLSDIPAMGLAGDDVDREMVEQPRKWDVRFIARFMVRFGLLSSVFDLLTFAALIFVFASSEAPFHTAWFVESLLTQLASGLMVRTRRPFFQSRPGRLLLRGTVALAVFAFALPFLPGADLLGFAPLPLPLIATLVGITLTYVVAVELAKRWFYRPSSSMAPPPLPALPRR